jgi:hypothetical protein
MKLVHFVNSASFCCLHLTCVRHRAFLIPMSHVSKADVVGNEAVLLVTKILRGKATASPSLVVRTSLTYIYQNKRFFPHHQSSGLVGWLSTHDKNCVRPHMTKTVPGRRRGHTSINTRSKGAKRRRDGNLSK